MKTTVSVSDFVDAFHAYDRYDQFGYEALRILFDFLEEIEDSTDTEVELDVIALCCEFSVDHYSDIASNYGIDLDQDDDEQDHIQAVLSYLEDHTIVCGQTDDQCNIVYQLF